MASSPDKVRLAIAICALRFKPPDQSFASYVLDLRTKFPISGSCTPEDHAWRDLARSLEHDYALLKAKYEAEQIKRLALENQVPSFTPSALSTSVESTTSKKKAKKKSSDQSQKQSEKRSAVPFANLLDLKSVLEGSQGQSGSKNILAVSRSDSLFSALDDCLNICALPAPPTALIISAVSRVMDSAGLILEGLLRYPVSSADRDVLGALELLLHTALSMALPKLAWNSQPSKKCRDHMTPDFVVRLFERVSTLILNRLVVAFESATNRCFDTLGKPHHDGVVVAAAKKPKQSRTGISSNPLGPSDPKALSVDIRAEMLSLFRTIFYLLDNHGRSMVNVPGLCLTLRASLTLETTRALEELLSKSPPCGPKINGAGAGFHGEFPPRRGLSREARARKLATKDTLWYLCAILHILFDEQPVTSGSHASTQGLEPKKQQGTSKLHGVDGQHLTEEAKTSANRHIFLTEAISRAMLRLVTRCKSTAFSMGSHHAHNHFGLQGLGFVDNDDPPEGRADRRTDVLIPSEYIGLASPEHEQSRGSGSNQGRTTLRISGTSEGCEARPYHDDDGKFELDEIGNGMLLGVLERYWLWQP